MSYDIRLFKGKMMSEISSNVCSKEADITMVDCSVRESGLDAIAFHNQDGDLMVLDLATGKIGWWEDELGFIQSSTTISVQPEMLISDVIDKARLALE